MSRISDVLHGGPVDAEEIARVRAVLMFEEPNLKGRVQRFAALLIMASAIATFGLLGDSVATVIGAMIVAPLMLPIMGLAFGISIGDRNAIGSSLLVGVAGIATAIGVGYVLSMPWSGLNVEGNAQIMARTAPRLVDLCAALATGLAGAFGTGRRDVSDTLPGVAIAISLVPPLANVGILLGAGRPDLAAGSMLLFVTNYLAILLTGSLMFGLMGFPKVALEHESPMARRGAMVIVLVLTIAIVLPLSLQTYRAATSNLAAARTEAAAAAWLTGSGYRVVSVNADGDVKLVVAGRGTLPSTTPLRAALSGRLFGKAVSVSATPEDRTTFATQ
jgi:uncharacterized hydrophobic protein (TIGR00271 family)